MLGLAISQAVLYTVVAGLSSDFTFGENFEGRPILSVVAVFATCFILYLGSLRVALKLSATRRLTRLIVIWAVLFRAILLFSQPIQEVDIYRYLWDGAVTAHGINPFRFAPAEVLAAEPTEQNSGEQLPNELQQLVQLRDESPAIAEILHRVHYADLVTVYPSVSQAVFALAASLTPKNAAVSTHVVAMKAVILLFDLTTIGVVWQLMIAAGRHPAWVIIYAWCPLVMKEFANSGHLDSIAVFLTTAAIWCCIRSFVGQPRHRLWPWSAAVLLGLAVGAKLYPVVLLPLMTVVMARRNGMRASTTFALTTLIVSTVTLMPMFVSEKADSVHAVARIEESPPLPNDPPRPASSSEPLTPANRASGLAAFLSRWEMNDFLFLVVVENLRQKGDSSDKPEPWFAVVPESYRNVVVSPLSTALSMDEGDAAFLLARALTSALFLGIVVWTLYVVARDGSVAAFLEAAFLTLAWFWLLSPTQNPWYWTWALPLVPFARGRAWIVVSGLVFIYYLRFWLLYQWADEPVFGTSYGGTRFFDFVATWLEFGPWFVWLAADTIVRQRKDRHAEELAETRAL